MAVWETEVDRFCRQYLQLESELTFPSPPVLKLPEVQDAIYHRAFSDGAVRYGPPPRFQARTLKALISQIEDSIDDWNEYEVSGDLLTAFSDLLSSNLPSEIVAVQQKAYVTYSLPNLSSSTKSPSVTLLENRTLISAGGTTGHRTWEAGLHLGYFLCQNPSIVNERRILELGAGTGFLSILCAKHLSATHVIASDGADEVVYNLPENLFLNDLEGSERIVPMDVKWGWPLLGTEDEKWNGGRPVDVVLGGDITYDRSVIPALMATVTDLFRLYPRVEVYISTAQRNEKTFEVFLKQCRVNGLNVQTLDFGVPPRDEQQGPFYTDSVDIKICKVSKQ